MYGQMTAGSWIYIGTQGIVQGTYETFGRRRRQAVRRHPGRDPDPHRRVRRHGGRPAAGGHDERGRLPDRRRGRHPAGAARRTTRYLDEWTDDLDDAPSSGPWPPSASAAAGASDWSATRPRCCRNCCGAASTVDIVTDQTSAHDPLAYCPIGVSVDEWHDLAASRPRGVHRAGRASRWPATSRRWSGSWTPAPRCSTTATRSATRPEARRLRPRLRLPRLRARVHPAAVLRGQGPVPLGGAVGRPRATSPRPTGPCSTCSRTTSRSLAGSARPRSGSRSRGCPHASAGSATASATRPGCAFNDLVARGAVSAPIVIGRDHLDCGSVASPYRETESMLDGIDAIADWPLLNALVNTASGATLGVDPPRRRRRDRPVDPRRPGDASPTARSWPPRSSNACSPTTRAWASSGTSTRATSARAEVAQERGVRIPMRRGRDGGRHGVRLLDRHRRAGHERLAQPCATAGDERRSGLRRDAALVVERRPGRLDRRLPRRAAARTSASTAAGAAVLPGFVDCHAHLVFAGDRVGGVRRADGRARPTPPAASATTVAATARQPTTRPARATPRRLVRELHPAGQHHVRDQVAATASRSPTRNAACGSPPSSPARRPSSARTSCRPSTPTTATGYLDLLTGADARRLRAARPLGRRLLRPGRVRRRRGPRGAARPLATPGSTPRVHANQLAAGSGRRRSRSSSAPRRADHCTHLTDADIDALRGRRTTVATLLPGAEFSTRSPYPDARRLLDAGVTVALATDCNPGTSYTTSMPLCIALAVREMRMTVAEAVWAATAGGAARAAPRRRRPARGRRARRTWWCWTRRRHVHLAYRPGVDLVAAVWRAGQPVTPGGSRWLTIRCGRARRPGSALHRRGAAQRRPHAHLGAARGARSPDVDLADERPRDAGRRSGPRWPGTRRGWSRPGSICAIWSWWTSATSTTRTARRRAPHDRDRALAAWDCRSWRWAVTTRSRTRSPGARGRTA